jgi:hypothetical protein
MRQDKQASRNEKVLKEYYSQGSVFVIGLHPFSRQLEKACSSLYFLHREKKKTKRDGRMMAILAALAERVLSCQSKHSKTVLRIRDVYPGSDPGS